MISFLDGVLEETDRESLMINVGGVGFSVFIPFPSAGMSAVALSLPPQDANPARRCVRNRSAIGESA